MVVIIAILASLILPRFLAQPERAIITEAQQILGAMRRGEQNWMDSTDSPTAGLAVDECGYAAPCANDATWAQIGMTAPAINARFLFKCDTAGVCTATRKGPGTVTYADSTITLNYLASASGGDGHFACGGKYSPVKASGVNDRGCTVS